MRIMTSWYLSKWSGAEVTARMTGGSVDRMHYIGGYLGLALGEFIVFFQVECSEQGWMVVSAFGVL